MKKITTTLAALSMFAFMAVADAQEPKPYKDGPVVYVSYIKVKNGKFDDYMAFLDTSYKTLMEAYKKAGLILGYSVYEATARSPSEPDLILTVSYPNMASLDKTDEFEAIASKVAGSNADQNKASISRDSMREVLGNEMIRELILK